MMETTHAYALLLTDFSRRAAEFRSTRRRGSTLKGDIGGLDRVLSLCQDATFTKFLLLPSWYDQCGSDRSSNEKYRKTYSSKNVINWNPDRGWISSCAGTCWLAVTQNLYISEWRHRKSECRMWTTARYHQSWCHERDTVGFLSTCERRDTCEQYLLW